MHQTAKEKNKKPSKKLSMKEKTAHMPRPLGRMQEMGPHSSAPCCY